MANIIRILRRIRFVPKRSSTAMKLAVLCAIVLSMVTLLTVGVACRNWQDQAAALKQQAAQLQQENDRLEDQIGKLGSQDSLEQIAREELGLANKDNVIFQPEG